MTYKIGTRVKKVRGKDIGLTGVVCSGPTCTGQTLKDAIYGSDMYVRFDLAWTNRTGATYPAGTVGMAISSNYEPILPDGHRAGEEGTCEPLDKLLSEVRDGQVV